VTLIGLFFLAILIGIASPTVYAENKEQDNHTFTQPFQNKTISLTGTSVRSTMYFTKIDYWDVKKASFNMTYQITQLKNNQTSDLTVAV
ncbi:cellulose synthase, partial [Enterococcus gallinarum]